MSFWGRKPERVFDISSTPQLDLAAGPVSVEIHFLANEAHTNAFVSIFGKLINDNKGVLGSCRLKQIEGKHPLNAVKAIQVPCEFNELEANAKEIAMALYMSENDEVVLVFECVGTPRRLLVAFDDPYFSLS